MNLVNKVSAGTYDIPAIILLFIAIFCSTVMTALAVSMFSGEGGAFGSSLIFLITFGIFVWLFPQILVYSWLFLIIALVMIIVLIYKFSKSSGGA
jgi:hypothetical protein